MEKEYQICTKCVMDTTVSKLDIDENGECLHCRVFDQEILPVWKSEKYSQETFKILISKIIKENTHKKYDCILGLSGGVDSSYAAYLAVKEGLRPLAVHVDGGWNSELAVSNIENIVTKLNIDLVTYVVDWEEMADLQRSFFKSGEKNCDIPQDHAFVAALFSIAKEHGIKRFISGYNFSTESANTTGFGHTFSDLAYLLDIHERYGSRPLKKYPTMSTAQRMINQKIFDYSYIDILNYFEYNKEDAKKILMHELDWRDYGGKHYESKFTKFFQAYYLPERFGLDKRRLHLTSLVHSGQMTREDALQELSLPLYGDNDLQDDKEFVLKKLSFSAQEWEAIMKCEPADTSAYRSDFTSVPFRFLKWLGNIKKRFNNFKKEQDA